LIIPLVLSNILVGYQCHEAHPGLQIEWSGEEDLVDEEAVFEEQMGKKSKREG